MDMAPARVRTILIILILAGVTLGLYAPTFHFDFVNYDDPVYVTGNAHVQKGLTWEGLRWAFTAVHGANWHPLTWLSHMADVEWFGMNAGAHHLVNVLIHTVNTLLLFFVLFRTTNAPLASAGVAALFAWHPLHVESVAWISERKDVLSTFFWLATMWFYAAYARLRSASPIQSAARVQYTLALVCFTLGLLSKPMLVTLPFVLLLLDAWPLKRACLQWADWREWRRLALEKWPFFALTIAASGVTFLAQRHGGAVVPLDDITIDVRVANALVAYGAYLNKMLWPVDLAVFYPHPKTWPAIKVAGCALVISLITAAAIWQARRRPFLTVGWFWYLGTLVPVIGLVQVGDQAYADRYTYVPLIGIFMAAAWGLKEWSLLSPSRQLSVNITGCLVLAVCGLLTHQQLQHWRNAEALFRHALAVTENNYIAHNNLGNVLVRNGKPDEAKIQYEMALMILPTYEEAHLNLGIHMLVKRLPEAAAGHFMLAAQLKPKSAEARYNLGAALAMQEKHAEAVIEYDNALALNPHHALAHCGLGISLANLQRLPEAENAFRKAVGLKPELALAHFNLGQLLRRSGQEKEAAEAIGRAAKLDPRFDTARIEVGANLLAEGRFSEAAELYVQILDIAPKSAQAHNNLGLALARLGRPRDAASHFAEVVKLEPNNADAHYNLANALSDSGSLELAAVHYEKALELNPNDAQALRKSELIRQKLSQPEALE